MSINKLDLGWVTVSDFKKSKKFFVDTLGLELNSEADEYGWLELQGHLGGAKLGVAQMNERESHKPGSNAVLTFTVDNIEQKKRDLESKGVKFTSDIMEVPGHVKLATFVDPDNNTFQLVQVIKE